tara:strand:- start:162 stop:635 length:474 start_codon:yes stop_codon:yes gene_type:complete
MDNLSVPIECAEDQLLPKYADSGAAGVDLVAYIPSQYINDLQQIFLDPGRRVCVKTGIRVAIPEGRELQIRPRSGLALKNGITVLNTPGTIDSSYRGEIGVILINHGSETFVITNGMRIAQAVCTPVVKMAFIKMDTKRFNQLKTDRMDRGFGSTGI